MRGKPSPPHPEKIRRKHKTPTPISPKLKILNCIDRRNSNLFPRAISSCVRKFATPFFSGSLLVLSAMRSSNRSGLIDGAFFAARKRLIGSEDFIHSSVSRSTINPMNRYGIADPSNGLGFQKVLHLNKGRGNAFLRVRKATSGMRFPDRIRSCG